MGALRQRGPGKAGPPRGSGCPVGRSLCLWGRATTHLESFISICCRISCLSSSVLLGKIFLSSNSCLLGRFLSFTAKSSFLHFLGSVPERHQRGGEKGRKHVLVNRWLVDLATHLLQEGFSIRAMGAPLSAWGAFQRERGQHWDKGMSPPMGHAFHGWAIDHTSQASRDGPGQHLLPWGDY